MAVASYASIENGKQKSKRINDNVDEEKGYCDDDVTDTDSLELL